MNAYIHSQLSVKKRKGKIEDYYAIHDFSDCSKEVESSNRHRVYFHTMWGIKNVIIPIFGHTRVNSDDVSINTKDLCENDHVLPDYSGKFIPTLSDFIDCVSEIPEVGEILEKFRSENRRYFNTNPKVEELLMSPLWNTGKVKSLLLTHNSWFVGYILPKIFPDIALPIADFSIAPSLLFNNMSYETWMQNGLAVPPSCVKISEKRKKSTIDETILPFQNDVSILPDVPVSDYLNVTFDGSRTSTSNRTID